MKIYVIRHGQTDCNKNHKFNGRYDEDINEEGIKQAKELSHQIKKLDIDLIICSPMIRTKHTCELININNISVIYDDRLIERDNGILTNKDYGDYLSKEYYNYYSTVYIDGMETLPELFKRVHSFIDEIKDKFNNKNILLVTHGAVARAIQFYFEPIPQDGLLFEISGQKNCEVKEYEL